MDSTPPLMDGGAGGVWCEVVLAADELQGGKALGGYLGVTVDMAAGIHHDLGPEPASIWYSHILQDGNWTPQPLAWKAEACRAECLEDGPLFQHCTVDDAPCCSRWHC